MKAKQKLPLPAKTKKIIISATISFILLLALVIVWHTQMAPTRMA